MFSLAVFVWPLGAAAVRLHLLLVIAKEPKPSTSIPALPKTGNDSEMLSGFLNGSLMTCMFTVKEHKHTILHTVVNAVK